MVNLFILFILLAAKSTHAQSCPKGEYPVHSHNRSAYYRSDGTHVSATTVENYCRQYRNEGPYKLSLKTTRPEGYPYKKEKFNKCSSEKENKIRKTFESLNKILSNIGEIKIYCANESVNNRKNPATSYTYRKTIIFYDRAFDESTEKIIAHELAHFLWDSLSEEEKRQYLTIAEWKIIPGQKQNYITSRINFSEEDGKFSPDEDFANNIESFLFNREIFVKNFANIAKWIEALIGDKK